MLSGAVRASTRVSGGSGAHGVASSGVVDVSLFDGEITAAAASAQVSAAATTRAVAGPGDAAVVNLQALGRTLSRGRMLLAGWGVLTVAAGRPTHSDHGGVGRSELALSGFQVALLRPHDGLPAGSVIEIATVDAAAATGAPLPARPPARPDVLPGDRPQLLPAPSGPLLGVPQEVTPPLTAGPYDFPVFGTVSYRDDFGTLAPGVDYQHGVSIYGALGQPAVAVAAGTLYGVGWSRASGNRLWLRDREGNEFLYAHLSAFSAAVSAGARVQAGEVIGFLGDTGNTQGHPTHLGFEVHPVSLLFLGSQGAVDPGAYLGGWRRVTSVALSSGPGGRHGCPARSPRRSRARCSSAAPTSRRRAPAPHCSADDSLAPVAGPVARGRRRAVAVGAGEQVADEATRARTPSVG